MEKENLIISAIAFVIMIIFFYLRNLYKMGKLQKGKRKRKNKSYEIIEVKYLSITQNLDKDKLLNSKIMLLFSVVNALIIDFVFLVVITLKIPIIVKMLMGLLLFLGLIYSVYGILGKIFIKRGYDKK